MTFLKARHISYTYPSAGNGDPVFSVNDISFVITEGEWVALLGANGAGKSTVLKIMAGVIPPHSGELVIQGAPLSTLSPRALARRVAWVPQEIHSSFAVTVEEMAALGRYPHEGWLGLRSQQDRAVVEDALRCTDMWALRHRLTPHLSGGEKRRLLLARALAQEPRLLLLDEPTAHLDVRHQREFLERVDELRRQRGLAVMSVLHDVNTALDWCPRSLIMKEGRLLADGETPTLFKEDLLKEAFGVAPRFVEDKNTKHRYIRF